MRKMPREPTFRNSAPVTTRNRNATRDLPVPVCLESPPLVLHFPEKIYLILETESPDIIRWETDTGIFRIVDHSRFEHETIPRWFKRKFFSKQKKKKRRRKNSFTITESVTNVFYLFTLLFRFAWLFSAKAAKLIRLQVRFAWRD